jgi:anti-sigma factor RsiW
MDRTGIHELTAAYALHALDPDDERAYEEHLARCPACRAELSELQETASALAYSTEAPPPPPALRDRILAEARAERSNVVPLRPRRRLLAATTAVAAAAAVAAIALGLWAASLSRSLDEKTEALRVLADPGSRTIGLSGAEGRLVVTPTGEAALVVGDLDGAPAGKAYEAWVIAGDQPEPAGLFDGQDERDVLRLDRPVPNGATVAVTLEDERGADAPTSDVLFSAQA